MLLCLTLVGCGKKAPETQQYVFEVAGTEATTDAGQDAGSGGVQTDTGQSGETATQDNGAAQDNGTAQDNGAVQDIAAGESAESEQNTAGSNDALNATDPGSESDDGQTASGTDTALNDEQSSTSSEQTAAQAEPVLDENGSYTTKEDVALYIHTYGKLPGNFITKKQAKKLGWDGGSLEKFAPGKCIGGDYFGNYEALLPDDKEYHECDIGTLGKKKRGAKRIIYSDDGYIYYTEDHYTTFELLYEP